MPVDGMPTLPQDSLERIMQLALKSARLARSDASVRALETEVQQTHARAHNQVLLAEVLARDLLPEAAGVTVPGTPAYPAPDAAPPPVVTGATQSFGDVRATVQSLTFYNQPEVITAMTRVRHECGKVLPMRLFCTTLSKSMKLEDFQTMQQQNYDAVQGFLKNQWVPNVKRAVEASLGTVAKGWFNLKEQSQEVYDVSKLRRFMCLVRLTMQDALRSLTLKSLKALASLVEGAGQCVLQRQPLAFAPNTLYTDQFKPSSTPLFSLDLVIEPDTHAFTFSVPVGPFEAGLLKVRTHTHDPAPPKLILLSFFF